MEALINIVLLTLLAAVTVGIVFQRNLFAVVVLAGIYSFLMASVLIVLDAVDVAMTEASVGAGVSTVVLLGTLHLVKSIEYPSKRSALIPMLVAGVTGAALVWGTDRPLALRHGRQRHQHARRPEIPRRQRQGDAGPERRDLHPGRLPRLRHAGRDDGHLHRRHRRDAAAQRPAAAQPGREELRKAGKAA